MRCVGTGLAGTLELGKDDDGSRQGVFICRERELEMGEINRAPL
jgi:hypothetical protein